ncbi:MAG: type III toxin-antitoxin system ToxN/AbiQ family toxin [Lachnospiraceae bacterium]|nr:type III toxin-antitoxin system ToxN/AbiQ family toxin [Lachnospiraceae bacterium]
MESIKLYEVDEKYIEYLAPYAPHLFLNRQLGQQNSRKYIGIVLSINDIDYFAPLTSFKDKHKRLPESIELIKVKKYAVINLNNMFPVPLDVYTYVDISKEHNPQYKSLLLAEYRFIKSIQNKIRKNAVTIYNHKMEKGNNTALAKRCNDFKKLEELCKEYR